ncbi:hypothetical protein PACID_24740 [Acidipropionibacterium acidipropionici ATCC 4875]|uniref:Uncharacterized protein n=1 Tax=Acidipropionibacterium acidipropionici (strain ATCC 4875 / DSM 20272 / JCM 6432 / NBRC 12425 / NCIMB 8070 / 4) TaxID=1171373 RepID=K7SM10_ACIA4|nr:hypothetical protein PACID_24740 [Acidipropionibacterium acidipropionici ATCC 4875]
MVAVAMVNLLRSCAPGAPPGVTGSCCRGDAHDDPRTEH